MDDGWIFCMSSIIDRMSTNQKRIRGIKMGLVRRNCVVSRSMGPLVLGQVNVNEVAQSRHPSQRGTTKKPARVP